MHIAAAVGTSAAVISVTRALRRSALYVDMIRDLHRINSHIVSAGYPIVDVKVTLYDGSYHDVDSSDMAFKIAASMGFRNAVEKAKPVLLEPVMSMEVTVPDDCMGDVIGDLNSRRGKVLGMDTKGHTQVIKSKVPMSEVLKYAPDLRSITSGRGEFHMGFSHYEELPAHLAEKVIKEAKARKQSEHNGDH
jgi:elongation factor G